MSSTPTSLSSRSRTGSRLSPGTSGPEARIKKVLRALLLAAKGNGAPVPQSVQDSLVTAIYDAAVGTPELLMDAVVAACDGGSEPPPTALQVVSFRAVLRVVEECTHIATTTSPTSTPAGTPVSRSPVSCMLQGSWYKEIVRVALKLLCHGQPKEEAASKTSPDKTTDAAETKGPTRITVLMEALEALGGAGEDVTTALVDGLLAKWPVGQLPASQHIVDALGRLGGHSSTCGYFAPHAAEVFARAQPCLGLCKTDQQRSALSTAYQAWAQSIRDSQALRMSASTVLDSTLDVLLTQWLGKGSTNVKQLRYRHLRTAGVLVGSMNDTHLNNGVQKVLPLLTSAIRKDIIQQTGLIFPVFQGLIALLENASTISPPLPAFDATNPSGGLVRPLLSALLVTLSIAVTDENMGDLHKLHRESLRAVELLARQHIDLVLVHLQAALECGKVDPDPEPTPGTNQSGAPGTVDESTNDAMDRARLAVVNSYRHLVGRLSEDEETLESRKDFVLSAVLSGISAYSVNGKRAAQPSALDVVKALAQCVIAMAPYGYLEHAGGMRCLEFIVSHASRPFAQETAAIREVRDVCLRVLVLMVSTIPATHEVLWPYVLECLCPTQNTEALPVLLHVTSVLADRYRTSETESEAYYLDFDMQVNLPRPQALLTRLLTLLSTPSLVPNLGVRVCDALASLGPILHPCLGDLFTQAIPKYRRFLDETCPLQDSTSREPATRPSPPSRTTQALGLQATSDPTCVYTKTTTDDSEPEAWNVAYWERRCMQLWEKVLDAVADEEWIKSAITTLMDQCRSYDSLVGDAVDGPVAVSWSDYSVPIQWRRCCLRLMGLGLQKVMNRVWVVDRLTDSLSDDLVTRHTRAEERDALAEAIGIVAATHLDPAVEVIRGWLRAPEKRKSGFFSRQKKEDKRREQRQLQLISTVTLAVGYTARYADINVWRSRWDIHLHAQWHPFPIKDSTDTAHRVSSAQAIRLITSALTRLFQDKGGDTNAARELGTHLSKSHGDLHAVCKLYLATASTACAETSTALLYHALYALRGLLQLPPFLEVKDVLSVLKPFWTVTSAGAVGDTDKDVADVAVSTSDDDVDAVVEPIQEYRRPSSLLSPLLVIYRTILDVPMPGTDDTAGAPVWSRLHQVWEACSDAWTGGSGSIASRGRSLTVILALLRSIERRLASGELSSSNGGGLVSFARYLGDLLPRCADIDPSVRSLAVRCLQRLLLVHARCDAAPGADFLEPVAVKQLRALALAVHGSGNVDDVVEELAAVVAHACPSIELVVLLGRLVDVGICGESAASAQTVAGAGIFHILSHRPAQLPNLTDAVFASLTALSDVPCLGSVGSKKDSTDCGPHGWVARAVRVLVSLPEYHDAAIDAVLQATPTQAPLNPAMTLVWRSLVARAYAPTASDRLNASVGSAAGLDSPKTARTDDDGVDDDEQEYLRMLLMSLIRTMTDSQIYEDALALREAAEAEAEASAATAKSKKAKAAASAKAVVKEGTRTSTHGPAAAVVGFASLLAVDEDALHTAIGASGTDGRGAATRAALFGAFLLRVAIASSLTVAQERQDAMRDTCAALKALYHAVGDDSSISTLERDGTWAVATAVGTAYWGASTVDAMQLDRDDSAQPTRIYAAVARQYCYRYGHDAAGTGIDALCTFLGRYIGSGAVPHFRLAAVAAYGACLQYLDCSAQTGHEAADAERNAATLRLVEVILNGLMMRAGPEETAAVRHAVMQALAAVPECRCPTDELNRYATPIIAAIVPALSAVEEAVQLAGVEALHSLLGGRGGIDDRYVVPVLMPVCQRVQTLMEHRRADIRSASAALLGDLARFARNASVAELFCGHVHTQLPSLLLHLNDADVDVRRASKTAIRALAAVPEAFAAPLFSQAANDDRMRPDADHDDRAYPSLLKPLMSGYLAAHAQQSRYPNNLLDALLAVAGGANATGLAHGSGAAGDVDAMRANACRAVGVLITEAAQTAISLGIGSAQRMVHVDQALSSVIDVLHSAKASVIREAAADALGMLALVP